MSNHSDGNDCMLYQWLTSYKQWERDEHRGAILAKALKTLQSRSNRKY